MPQIKIEVGVQTFTATLLDNPTTRALLKCLPMAVSMHKVFLIGISRHSVKTALFGNGIKAITKEIPSDR